MISDQLRVEIYPPGLVSFDHCAKIHIQISETKLELLEPLLLHLFLVLFLFKIQSLLLQNFFAASSLFLKVGLRIVDALYRGIYEL